VDWGLFLSNFVPVSEIYDRQPERYQQRRRRGSCQKNAGIGSAERIVLPAEQKRIELKLPKMG